MYSFQFNPVSHFRNLAGLGLELAWAKGIPNYMIGSSTIISCVLLYKSCGICYISTTLPCWSGVEGVQELDPASALVRSWWQRRWPNKIILSLSKKFKNLYHDTSDCFWQFIGQSRKLFFYLDVLKKWAKKQNLLWKKIDEISNVRWGPAEKATKYLSVNSLQTIVQSGLETPSCILSCGSLDDIALKESCPLQSTLTPVNCGF